MLNKIGWICYTARNNSHMAEIAMRLICDHNPIFTIGHNVYDFDNLRLACALPSDSKFRKYFIPTSHNLGKSVSSMGFIMAIPGINNLDTFRYIKKAMAQRFRSFALGNLAMDLNLKHQKLDTSHMEFSLDWYQRSIINTIDMINYNMIDCEVTLDLCFTLDLINQMVALTSITRSYILDVMLSSAGSIAASCICNYAHQNECRYVWTRCDHRPELFEGGEVHFKRPIVCSFPMIIDFVSMYPTIIACTNISPESIDYIDLNTRHGSRFSLRLAMIPPIDAP
jgi:DNA polymerase elongation subunit (family B)